MKTKTAATIEDLYRVEGKVEIVGGEIVLMAASGFLPSRASIASIAIAKSLLDYERRTGLGYAFGGNAGFHVHLPDRKSFSPDASFYTGKPTGMKFLEGSPIFAAEIRSEFDYGPRAERLMARKRADYFTAGTLVVWDVDLLSEDVVRVYRASNPDPENPTTYKHGDTAEAEPALPGWTMPVDELFT